jgi:hypothetical protein
MELASEIASEPDRTVERRILWDWRPAAPSSGDLVSGEQRTEYVLEFLPVFAWVPPQHADYAAPVFPPAISDGIGPSPRFCFGKVQPKGSTVWSKTLSRCEPNEITDNLRWKVPRQQPGPDCTPVRSGSRDGNQCPLLNRGIDGGSDELTDSIEQVADRIPDVPRRRPELSELISEFGQARRRSCKVPITAQRISGNCRCLDSFRGCNELDRLNEDAALNITPLLPDAFEFTPLPDLSSPS